MPGMYQFLSLKLAELLGQRHGTKVSNVPFSAIELSTLQVRVGPNSDIGLLEPPPEAIERPRLSATMAALLPRIGFANRLLSIDGGSLPRGEE